MVFVLFETNHFCFFLSLQMLSQPLLRTIHLGHINTDCTVFTVTIFKSPSLQRTTYRFTSLHFSNTLVCSFTELRCHKNSPYSCARTYSQSSAAARSLHHRNSSMSPLLRVFITHFVYFLASANRLRGIY